MKKVVLEENDVVYLSEVSELKYYGVFFDNQKSFITKRNYFDGDYSAFLCMSVTKGNSYDGHDSCSLKETINSLISSSFIIYEFDTPKELFTWLAE